MHTHTHIYTRVYPMSQSSSGDVDLRLRLVVNGDFLVVAVGAVRVHVLVDLAVKRITLSAVILHLVDVDCLVLLVLVGGWYVLVDDNKHDHLLAVLGALG